MAYQPHPYAGLFPMMGDKDLRELTASVREDGLQEPILTFKGKVLDGRNRQLACSNAKVKPVYRRYTGDDPLGYVIRANLHRRHLTTSQRAAVAADLANLEDGQRASSKGEAAVTQTQAADLLNVSKRSVERAKKVKEENPEAFEKIKSGEQTVGGAVKALKPVAPSDAENNCVKRQWETKAHHLSLDDCTSSLCNIERIYKGHNNLKLIDPLKLPTLVNGLPEQLPGVPFHKGVCAKCWKKLVSIFSPAADQAARDAITSLTSAAIPKAS